LPDWGGTVSLLLLGALIVAGARCTQACRLTDGFSWICQMDDVVAVQVELDDGTRRYFVTWGRIQSPVDPAPLAELVLRYATTVISAKVVQRARVCTSLMEAASSDAPYFYEGLLRFSISSIPFGTGYEEWRVVRASAMASGHDIYYCGDPDAAHPDERDRRGPM
jgi:hypothetical protein